MDDYEYKKLEWLMSSSQRSLTLNEIYQGAELRQLKLIEKCFESCVDTLKEEKDSNPSWVELTIRLKNGSLSVNHENLEEMQNVRYQMCNLINKFSDLKLVDGNVKNKERAKYKLENKFLGNTVRLDDINRVTITSTHYSLIESFLEKFNAKFSQNEIFPRPDWDIKPMGFLSRSNDVLIDGFPAEVHLNETNQLMLGLAFTHKIYEVVRLTNQDPCFKIAFHNLPQVASKSIQEKIKEFSPLHQELLHKQLKDLSILVDELSRASIEDKKQALSTFHRKAHQSFIAHAEKEWIDVYLNALGNYNKKNKDKMIVIPELQNKKNCGQYGGNEL